MKNSIFKIICCILLCSAVTYSCKETPPDVKLLVQAQKIADNNPIEALILLDSISNPEAMGQDYYMQYIVTRVQAKFKNSESIADDILIFKAKKYFDTKTDPYNSALAHFYSGNVYYQNNQVDKALVNYMEADHYAGLSKNIVLMARSQNNIGHLYYEQDVQDSAIFHYRLALNYYNKVQDADLLKMQTTYSMGAALYSNYDLDSAYHYFDKGLSLAKSTNNQKYLGIFTNCISVVDRMRGNYTEAVTKLHTALTQATVSVDSSRIYLNLAKLYNITEQHDSAHYYTNLLKNRLANITDKEIIEETYASLSEHNKQIGNYIDALRYAELESKMKENIQSENQVLELFEANKKYALDQKAKKKN